MTDEQERKELEEKIALLELSRINLRVTPAIFDTLNRQAEFHGLTIEEHCTNILLESLDKKVGAAFISTPSHLSGTETKKIMGPSITSTVTRG